MSRALQDIVNKISGNPGTPMNLDIGFLQGYFASSKPFSSASQMKNDRTHHGLRLDVKFKSLWPLHLEEG